MSMRDLAHEVADGHLVVFGGGGYNLANVARTWTNVASTLVDFDLHESVPLAWQKLFEALVGEKAPSSICSDNEAMLDATNSLPQRQATEILKDLKRRIPLLA